jgi:thymidylate synthase (FAD)
MRQLDRAYRVLIKLGASPQIARSVLPNSLKTEIVWTCNFREWKHILRLRTDPKAHPQMIQIAVMIEKIMQAVAPEVFPKESTP